jgi:hypothetical protein
MDGEAGAKKLNASRPSSDVDVSAPEISSAWSDCVSDTSPNDWLALAYDGKKKLKLLGTGAGGFASLRPLLTDDAVVYGAFVVKLGSTTRRVFISSIGEMAGAMVKGRAAMHTQDIENALEGTTAAVQVASQEELEPAALAARLGKAMGGEVTL